MADGTIRAAVIGYGLAGSVFHAPLIARPDGGVRVVELIEAARQSADSRSVVAMRA